ncbi:beta-1,6-N-acetylglucosaminyltransferase [Niabella hibiscisoli]|uniref:beta-1,6-N-acetylglucosaminyltransferase n=1 Tax=Niabella hibiscisoli TaxID=1825928 RepID=UPI0021D447AB|nr:beta-1,6-N-acetylglucosaminyltransferase [Niabella hibiscisoli]
MNLCHLIITYKNADQLARLINALTCPGSDIFVHVDKKIDITQFERLKEKTNVTFVKNRVKVNWGGFSLINAITASIAEIKASETKYDFINLISGQDYPIKK